MENPPTMSMPGMNTSTLPGGKGGGGREGKGGRKIIQPNNYNDIQNAQMVQGQSAWSDTNQTNLVQFLQ